MQNRIASMPINIERPRSALLRGVKITEFKGHILNPDPILLQETDFLLEEFLSPTKLKALTGVNDLGNVKLLEMIVDTSETSLGNFGIYLPNLKQLKLNGSYVPRIRDLGTSLVHLKVLWLSRSGLVELDGIPTLQSLEEVYLAYNEITDISPCSLLDNLRCLDLEGNLIDDLKQVEFLNLCSDLENLTLYGNPLCIKPNQNSVEDPLYSYRHEVIKILSNLKILDDELTLSTKPLSAIKSINNSALFSFKNQNQSNKEKYNYECPFDDDWHLINQFIEEGIGPSEEKLAINESLKPGTSSSRGSRPNTSVRPLSAMRPLSSYRIKTPAIQEKSISRMTSESNNSNTTSRVNTTERSSSSDQISDIINDSSSLTVGPTLQGNPLKALMARKKTTVSNLSNLSNSLVLEINYPESTKIRLNKTIEHLENRKTNLENKALHNELIVWRKEHAKKLEERKQYFEPQILKIEDNFNDNNASKVFTDHVDVNSYDFYDEYHDIKYSHEFNELISDNKFSREIDTLISPRAASASFYRTNEAVINGENYTEESDLIKQRKKRSKSKDRISIISRSSIKLGEELIEPSYNQSLTNREDTHSRLETADTGYASFSSISTSLNNVSSLSSISDRFSQQAHQPIIVSSHLGTNLIKAQLIQQQQSSAKGTNTLKQLKTNLTPLSTSYMQKK